MSKNGRIKELMHLWNCSEEEAKEMLFEEELAEGFNSNYFCDNTRILLWYSLQ